MKFKLKRINNQYLLIYLIIIITCFFPFYIRNTNDYNLKFTMLQIPVIIFILCNIRYFFSRNKKNLFFLCVILLYFCGFIYESILYSECYWAAFYRTCIFLMIWILIQYRKNDREFDLNFDNFIIAVFTLSVLCSLIFYLWGGEAIILNMDKITIRRQGVFSDSRLTWLFIHKSAYGLLIDAVLSLIIRKKNNIQKYLLIILYFIALYFVNSMVSLVSAILIVFAEYIRTKEITKQKIIRVCLLMVGISIISVVLYYYIILKRDLSTLGSRLYIWNAVPELFKKYPHGMGLDFANETFVVDVMGFTANNLHNVILNEILHYGRYIGILFLVLLIYIPIHFIRFSKNKVSDIILIVAMLLPMVFDQALNDLTFPLYMLILVTRFSDFKYHVGGKVYVSD